MNTSPFLPLFLGPGPGKAMRYAIFSDIQGNRQAWEAVLDDMKRQQLQMTVCLGDVVGCGPNPHDVLCGVRAETEMDGTGTAATDPPPVDSPPPEPKPAPEPQPKPEPPTVAVVPDPEPTPPEPMPAPPPSGPPPMPPEPENAAATTPLAQGLVFYVPLEESETAFTARDVVGGRDLDVTGGLPGVMGRVGFGCALEKQNNSSALTSQVKPLPELKAITISFWIKRPDPSDADDPGAKPLPAGPPMNLVSLKDYCDVRLDTAVLSPPKLVAHWGFDDNALYDDLPAEYAEKMVKLTSNETGKPVRRPLRDVLRERYAEITAMDGAIGKLRSDPGETNNILKSNPELARDLQTRLRTWQESVLHSLQDKDYR